MKWIALKRGLVVKSTPLPDGNRLVATKKQGIVTEQTMTAEESAKRLRELKNGGARVIWPLGD